MVAVNVFVPLGCALAGYCYHTFLGNWYIAVYAFFVV